MCPEPALGLHFLAGDDQDRVLLTRKTHNSLPWNSLLISAFSKVCDRDDWILLIKEDNLPSPFDYPLLK
jgi:hypothetical protein